MRSEWKYVPFVQKAQPSVTRLPLSYFLLEAFPATLSFPFSDLSRALSPLGAVVCAHPPSSLHPSLPLPWEHLSQLSCLQRGLHSSPPLASFLVCPWAQGRCSANPQGPDVTEHLVLGPSGSALQKRGCSYSGREEMQ